MDNSDSSTARGDRILFWKALFSGGIAGLSVDIALYPIDTVKTRIQSPQGFFRAGGFRDMYKGISVVAMGSAPGAALFFSTYESMKHVLNDRFGSGVGAAEQHTTRLLPQPAIHMLAASIGEVIACIVRVPTEVIKQRMQAGSGGAARASMWDTFSSLWRTEGVQGLYKGFNITIMREIPFAFIQFPIYESLKVYA
jgi:solute carrier family 25 S-adenosylmethionine transporter 26